MLTEYHPDPNSWMIVAGSVTVIMLFIGLLSRFQPERRDDLCVGCDESNSRWVWKVLAAGAVGVTCAKCGKTWRAS